MPNFNDIVEQYDKIKDKPEVTDPLRVRPGIKRGLNADAEAKRQKFLPDAKAHYRLQDRLSRMFDKSSRAGAKTTLGGLVMPNGRKMFADFHDNYTGTGRFQKQVAPDKVLFPDNGPKIDPYPNKVILYERCMDCRERADRNNFIPAMTFVPTGEALNPMARSKWASVDIKPGTVLCYLFCVECPTKLAKEINRIKHDPIKSNLFVSGPGGILDKPISLAEKESQALVKQHGEYISDNVFQQIKYHRDLPETDVFYGNCKLN